MIEVYVDNIKWSLQNKCYFPALALALALPDMCGMVEYPGECVSKRYVDWYDKYIGEFMAQNCDSNPWLSGEVVYNLRNTFLHQGAPNIDSDKVNEPVNKLDKFILLLGDGTVIEQATWSMKLGSGERAIDYNTILVDVTYLCNALCDFALCYYTNHKDRFLMKFDVITQEEFLSAGSLPEDVDVAAKLINRKLAAKGRTERVVETPEHNVMKTMSDGIQFASENGMLEGILINGGELQITTKDYEEYSKKEIAKKSSGVKKLQKSKWELKIRSFFGQHIKEQKYKDKKEEIIKIVLEAKSKSEVNNKLMNMFRDEELKLLYKELKPLIKDLPGK